MEQTLMLLLSTLSGFVFELANAFNRHHLFMFLRTDFSCCFICQSINHNCQ